MKHKRETFKSPYEEVKHLTGLKFKVMAQIETEDKETAYKIKLETGTIIEAWPEEVLNNTPTKLQQIL